MNRVELADALRDLKTLSFPPHSANPHISEILWALLELDGYYVGIASTVLGGGRISYPVSEEEFTELLARLKTIRPATEGERAEIVGTERYVAAIRRVARILLGHS